MRGHHFTTLAALALAALTHQPLRAQEANPTTPEGVQVIDAYTTLMQSITSGVNEKALFTSILAQVGDILIKENAQVARMERDYPGSVDQLLRAITPVLERHSNRVTGEFRQSMVAMLKQRMTQAEALDAAAFYSSPLGRRVIGAVQENYSVAAMGSELAASNGEGDITTDAILRDRNRTVAAAISALTAQEEAEMERMLSGKSWPMKLGAMREPMAVLRARMENAPMLPEDEAEMMGAIDAAMRDYAQKMQRK